MFTVLEKQGERRAVYSKGDLAYLRSRGWHPVDLSPPIHDEAPCVQEAPPKKRGRPAKAK